VVLRRFSCNLPYGFGAEVGMGYDEAVRRTREALGKEGFGVLTEIDVADNPAIGPVADDGSLALEECRA